MNVSICVEQHSLTHNTTPISLFPVSIIWQGTVTLALSQLEI